MQRVIWFCTVWLQMAILNLNKIVRYYKNNHFIIFVAVFLGCTRTGRVGLCFLWFFVQELPKTQPAVVLVLKRLRRQGNCLKCHPTDWEKPGIEPVTPGLQDIGFHLLRWEIL